MLEVFLYVISAMTDISSTRIPTKARKNLESVSLSVICQHKNKPRKFFEFPRSFLRSNEHRAHKKALGMQALQGFVYAYCSQITAYLFENCGALRAALRPYFLRSFIRGSRVKNPAFLRTGL